MTQQDFGRTQTGLGDVSRDTQATADPARAMPAASPRRHAAPPATV